MGDPPCSFGCRFNLRQHDAGVIEKSSTRRCELNAPSAAYQEWRAYLVLKIPNLPA
jgi:hypothetical protein